MVEPVSFPTTTQNLKLPLLFSGQAQKEFFLNQAFAMLDALYNKGVEASLTSPPDDPAEGSAYRVLAPATDDWTEGEDHIALFIGGSWVLVNPALGISVFDRSAGQIITYYGSWTTAVEPNEPTGGTVIDAEARAAISALIEAMRSIGAFTSS